MKNWPILALLITSTAYAQLFAGNGPKVKWSCPQHDYPEIKQLDSEQDVQVRLRANGNNLEVSFKPNIFKVQPLSQDFIQNLLTKKVALAVDYSDCIDDFKAKVAELVQNEKTSQCGENSNSVLCQKSTADIMGSVEEQIQNENYFKRNAERVSIPRLIPNTSAGISTSEAANAVNRYCNGESARPDLLFSKEVLDYLLVEARSTSSKIGEECHQELTSNLEDHAKKISQGICPNYPAVCNRINESFQGAKRKIIESTKAIAQTSEKSDQEWRQRFEAISPEEEALASQEIAKRLSEIPFKCDAFNYQIPVNNKYFNPHRLETVMANNIDKLSEVADSDCIKSVIQNYALALTQIREEDATFKAYCQKKMTPLCREVKEKTQKHAENIRRLFGAGYGELGQRFLTDCDDCLESPARSLEDILKRVQDSRQAITCIDLKPGEAKIVSFRDGAPSGLGSDYALRKKSDGSTDVIINLDVKSDGAHGVSAQEMFNRVRSCINDVTPYMKGPQEQMLNLKIMSPAEVATLPLSERPRANSVDIQAAGGRSNARSYEADIDCPTITHEVLHLLGLCDEYNGTSDGYGCRTAPKIASIMSSQNAAFSRAVPQTFECKCDPGSPCHKIMSTNDSKLRSLYMMPTIYSATEYEFRNKACKDKSLTNITWNTQTNSGRSINPIAESENSIVVQTQTVGEEYPKLSRTEFSCSCKSDDQKCLEELQTFKKTVKNIHEAQLTFCPPGAPWTPPVYGIKMNTAEKYEWNGSKLKFVKMPEWPSLLHPNHYERIAGGACDEKAKKYNQCAIWAYRDPNKTNNCEGKPEHCSNDEDFLGVTNK